MIPRGTSRGGPAAQFLVAAAMEPGRDRPGDRWACRPCHDYAHANVAEAYERGWLERRNGAYDDEARREGA